MKNPSYPRAHYNRFSDAFEIVFPDGSSVCHAMSLSASPLLEAGVYLSIVGDDEVDISWVEEEECPDADGFGGIKSETRFSVYSCVVKSDGAYGKEVNGLRQSHQTAYLETAVAWAKAGDFEVARVRF